MLAGYKAAFGKPFVVEIKLPVLLALKSPNKIPSLVTWSALSTNTQVELADLL